MDPPSKRSGRAPADKLAPVVPLVRRRAWVPFVVSVILAVGLVLSGLLNLRSVRETVRGNQRAWVADVGLGVHQALYGVAFLNAPADVRAALERLVQGPVRGIALFDAQGRVFFAVPDGQIPDASLRALRAYAAAPREPLLRQLSGGDRPVYEIFLIVRPRLPEPVRRQLLESLSRARLVAGPLEPRAIFLRAVVQVGDEAAARSLRRARFVHVVEMVAALLLLLVGTGAFWGERRHLRMRWLLERQRALAETGEMAAVLAHEIRNPVGILRGRAQLLLSGEVAPDREALRALVDQSERLDRLVTRLLDFARPAPPAPEPVEAEALVAEAVQAVADRALARQVALVQDVAPGRVVADREMLVRALVNLLDNAIRVSPEGGRVTVRYTRRRAESRFVVIDDGPGLPADLGEEIFKPFVSGRPDGPGLGLAIVRRIAEVHGGRVTAENAPGRGARFELVVPHAGPPARPAATTGRP